MFVHGIFLTGHFPSLSFTSHWRSVNSYLCAVYVTYASVYWYCCNFFPFSDCPLSTGSAHTHLHYWCFRFQLFFLIKFITVKIPFSLCTSNWQGFLPFFGKGVTDRPRPERTWLIKRKKRIEINIQSKYLGGVVSIF